MTDFFAQLGARHRGEAEVLQPRVPFRFEPVSASLAAADLTGGPAAESGWRAPHPDWPFRRPTGPGRADEPWTGPPAGDGGEPAGPEPASAMAGRPRPAGLRPVHPAWPLGDQAADMDVSGTGRARGAASGRAWRAGQDPRSAVAARHEPGTLTLDPAAPGSAAAPKPAAVLEPATVLAPAAVLKPAELRAPPGRRAVAGTVEPGTVEPGTGRRRTAARAADLAALGDGRPGLAGDPDDEDMAAAGQSLRRAESALRPDPPDHTRRQLSAVAPAPARRPADQRSARDHAAGEPAGPGQETITVQVTIGRVEVRAAPPAPRAATSPRPAAGPSLADYLRHRSRSAGARP
jgi:hypothetical protein